MARKTQVVKGGQDGWVLYPKKPTAGKEKHKPINSNKDFFLPAVSLPGCVPSMGRKNTLMSKMVYKVSWIA